MNRKRILNLCIIVLFCIGALILIKPNNGGKVEQLRKLADTMVLEYVNQISNIDYENNGATIEDLNNMTQNILFIKSYAKKFGMHYIYNYQYYVPAKTPTSEIKGYLVTWSISELELIFDGEFQVEYPDYKIVIAPNVHPINDDYKSIKKNQLDILKKSLKDDASSYEIINKNNIHYIE